MIRSILNFKITFSILVCVLLMCGFSACSGSQKTAPFHLAEPGDSVVSMKYVRGLQDSSRGNRDLGLTIWYPGVLAEGQEAAKYIMNLEADHRNAPYPLILASSMTVSSGFGELLASHGFVVVGVNAMNPYDPWGDKMVDYPLDILFALDTLAAIPPEGLTGMIDTDNVGVMGYSFDGYNALALSGPRVDPEFYRNRCSNMPDMPPGLDWWPDYICAPAGDWKAFSAHAGETLTSSDDGLWQPMADERIRAAIPMGVEGYTLYGDRGLAAIDIPVMIMHATADELNPYTMEAVPIFEALQTPDKVMISFIDLGHMMIFDEEPIRRMGHFAVAFFGYHLQGQTGYAKYFDEKYIQQFDDLAWGVYEEQ